MYHQCSKIVVLILVIVTTIHATESSIIVNTSKGPVLGKTINTAFGKTVNVWNSIPFAKPPVGKLRFKYPISIEPWKETLNTTNIPNVCYQDIDNPLVKDMKDYLYKGKNISEDCLYLTVVAPEPLPKNASVMVWIHGGSNALGSSSAGNQAYKSLVADSNIVIVAIQYRLSVFGFLYGGTTDIPGNAGFYDQVLALQWIQDNIVYFGGDPNRVTLAGQGSGATNVGLHLLSPMSSKYYSQGILQSGSPNNIIGTMKKSDGLAKYDQLANAVNCSADNISPNDVLECLQSVNPKDLVSALPIAELQPIPDGNVIMGDRSDILGISSKKYRKNVMIGTVGNEGGLTLGLIYPEKIPLFKKNTTLSLNASDFITLINKIFPNLTEEAKKLIQYNYMNWDDPENNQEIRKNLAKMLADLTIDCDTNTFVDWAYIENWSIFRYLFNYSSSYSIFPPWVGAYNNIDVDFEFGCPFELGKYSSDEDKFTSKLTMNFIANFVKTGDPNKNAVQKDHDLPHWPKFTNNRSYMNMIGYNSSLKNNYHKNKDCILWKEFISFDEHKYCFDLTKDIDPTTIDPDEYLTVSKLVTTTLVNPNSSKLAKFQQNMRMQTGPLSAQRFGNKNQVFESKSNTTTKYFGEASVWTMTQDSRSYTKIAG